MTTDTKSEFRDLRFLGALRTLTLFGVIIGHCAWYVNFIPSINPIFVEDVSILMSFGKDWQNLKILIVPDVQ